MGRIKYYITFACLAALLGYGNALGKGSVVNSPHNLSASGGGGKHGVAFSDERRICVFCHVPHNTKAAEQLWSRKLPPLSIYDKPYDSTTLKAMPKPDKPTGASRLCLSCHDGTIALEEYVGGAASGSVTMPSDVVPTRNPNLTNVLADDHPVSFAYTEALAAQQRELASPATLPVPVRLQWGLMLECTACHDPHNNEFGDFLVIDNSASGSPLCVACHKNSGWQTSSHNPLVNPAMAPGCMNCHYAHNAPNKARLLHAVKDEDNCYLNCHNSSASPSQNVKPLFDPTLHRHPVDIYAGAHDENEALPAQVPHVECVDCHNPHQANSAGGLSSPPNINGALAGVRKDAVGAVATREYEICYKCHAGGLAANFSGINETRPNRMINEPDQQKRFDGQNPSFHPVMAQRRGDGSSLLESYRDTMRMIYCSDCHNSDQSTKAGGGGPNGPHGSRFEHILMAQYDMPRPTDPRESYTPSQYDLCYRCHSEGVIMGGSSGFANQGVNEHARHVRDRGIPCFACHDPHGISWTSGTSAHNAHLINFDKDYAADVILFPEPHYDTPSSSGSGSCAVKCHTTGVPDPRTHSYVR